jgi:hypothetical protein
MANNASDEEIIEKRPSNPVATACLILASVALLGGIAYQIAEISEVRATKPVDSAADQHRRLFEKHKRDFEGSVKKVIDENDHPEIVAGVREEGARSGGALEGSAPPPRPAPRGAPEADAAPVADPAADSGETEDVEPPAEEEPAAADPPMEEEPAAEPEPEPEPEEEE